MARADGRRSSLSFCVVALVVGCAVLLARSALAESFDWRNVGGKSFVTPVKSQFGGTCWAFGDVASLECKYMLTRNDPSYVPDLSEQQIVWETDPDMGSTSGGGAYALAFNYFATHGVVSEAECPANPGTDQPGSGDPWPLADGWENRVWKAESYKVDFATSLQQVKDGLKQYGPLTINMSADDDWYPSPGLPRGGHCVLLVGFQDDPSAPGGGYWIIKNSWGTGWSDGGFGKIPYSRRPLYPGDANALTGPVYYTGAMATATWKNTGWGSWRQGGTRWTSAGSTSTWQNRETLAVFGGSGMAVNLFGTVIAHGMVIEPGSTGYSFAGGTGLTLTGGGISAAESITLGTPITIGAPQTWNVDAGKSITVNQPIHTVVSMLTLTGAGDVTINAKIDGGGVLNTYGAKPGSVNKKNTGALTLPGTSYDNDFSLQAGTLYVTPAGGATVSFGGAFYGSGAMVIDSAGDVWLGKGASDYYGKITRASGGALHFQPDAGVMGTYRGVIDGTGDVVQDGAGTTGLAATNTYTGQTRIRNGALRATIGQGIPADGFVSLEGGVLESAGTTTFTRSLGTSGAAFQWAGDGGGFSAGSGSMIVRINDGAETLTWGTNVGNEIVGTLKLSSTSARYVTDFQNGIDLGGADRTIHVADNPDTSGDYAQITGAISGDGAGIVKTGDGTLLLTRNNTYTGATTIRGGVLRANAGAGLPADSYLVLDGGVLESHGTASFTRTLGASGSGDRVCWGSGGGGFSAGTGAMTVRINNTTGTINWGTSVGAEIVGTLMLSSKSARNVTTFENGINLGGAARTIHVEDNPGYTTDYAILSGAISGDAGCSLTKTGPGKLHLTGSQGNTYSGTTTLTGGDVELDKSSGYAIPGDLVLGGDTGYFVRFRREGQMPSTARWIWDHAPVSDSYQEIELLGHNQTVAGIWDDSQHGVIQNAWSDTSVGACTLTVNNSEDCAYNGYLRNGNSSAVARLSLVKTGSGTLTLSRDHIYYTGTTTISEGALVLEDAYGFNSSSITNNARFEIRYNYGAHTFNRSVSGNGTFVLAGTKNITLGGSVSGGIALEKRGDMTAIISGRKYYTGGTTIYDGELRLASSSGPAIRGDVTFIRPDVPESSYRTLTMDGENQLESTAKIHFGTNSVLQLNSHALTVGGLDYDVSSGYTAAIRNGGTSGKATLTIDVPDSETYVYYGMIRDTSSGTSSNPNEQLALVKRGAGTQRIRGSNYPGQYSGGLTVYDGTLDYSGGTLPGGDYAIHGGTLDVGSQSRAIGAFQITGGVVDGGGILTSSAAYDVRGGTVNVRLAGTSGLIKSASTIATLTGNNTYTGGTTVAGGTLVASTGAALGAAGNNVTIAAGSTLEVVSGPLNLTASALLSNNGSLVGSLALANGAKAQGAGDYGDVRGAAGGVFSPGDVVGVATTDAATWESGGKYLFEISDADGVAGTGWDLWNLAGNLSIAAAPFTVAVATLAGGSSGLMADFDQADGYSWRIASTDGMISGFANLALDTSLFENSLAPAGELYLSHTAGQDLYLNYNPGTLTPGDADGNHIVDEVDAAVLARHWLQHEGVGWLQGDFNGDQRVDDLDASILAAHWQYTGGAAAVPEPETLALVAFGLVALTLRRRRGHSK